MSRKIVLLTSMLLSPILVSAQSAQKWGVQASAFMVGVNWPDGSQNGFGGELQLRVNQLYVGQHLAVSLGAGLQSTSSSSGTASIANHFIPAAVLSGVFLEPRLVVDLGLPVYPYLAGRLTAYSFQVKNTFQSGTSTVPEGTYFFDAQRGISLGFGIGCMVSLSKRINLDVGVQRLSLPFGPLKGRFVHTDGSIDTYLDNTDNSMQSMAFRAGFAIGF
jgi:hypothetical protein